MIREPGEKFLAAPAADREFVVIHSDGLPRHSRDMIEIYKIALVAPYETFGWQRLFYLLELAAYGDFLLCQMKRKIMPHHLHKTNVARVKFTRAVLRSNEDMSVLVSFHIRKRLAQFGGKHRILHWLYDKIERVHRITAHGVLRHVRNEYYRGIFVRFAQFFRSRHAVHMRHFDIQQYEIVLGGIIADKIHAVAERFYETLFARLALETADEILQTAHLILVILHDDYPHNIYPLRMITRYN